jgi:hypothetical protein
MARAAAPIASAGSDFPKGTSITRTNAKGATTKSCIDWCAYHSSFKLNGQLVSYAVLPDLTDGSCPTFCSSGTKLDSATAIHAHELAEAITDPPHVRTF